jgi:hypothetical protein
MLVCAVSDSAGISGKRKKTVWIKGSATFDNEQELQQIVNKALHASECLEIRCEHITRADFSFVMLICSTHRTAELFNKRLIIRGTMPDDEVWHYEHARYARERGCLFAAHRKCRFWKFLVGAISYRDNCPVLADAAHAIAPAIEVDPETVAAQRQDPDVEASRRGRATLRPVTTLML